jgi:two-component system, NarL family, sensor kinase
MAEEPAAGRPVVAGADADQRWLRLTDSAGPAGGLAGRRSPPTVRRVVGRFVLVNVIAVGLLLAGSVWASYMVAKREALGHARETTGLLASLLIEPNLTDAVLSGDPGALDRLDDMVEQQLRDTDVVRVKIWDAESRIIYSDEQRLVGRVFPQGPEELGVLRRGGTLAEISEVDQAENVLERTQGPLLEVYRQIHAPSGDPLLLEAYFRYDEISGRQRGIWLSFAPISAAVLLLLMLLQLPLAFRMVRQVREGDRERLVLHARAADASTEERRRIAGGLHDGVVQDLGAAAFVMSSAVHRLQAGPATESGNREIAGDLAPATDAVRQSVTSLRSLMIEIYPPNLAQAGLGSALTDLMARLQGRGVRARLDMPDDLDLPPETAALLFRVAQEALLNIARHARAATAAVVLSQETGVVTMEIHDDGVGFDPRVTAAAGHFGLQVLADLATEAGGTLDLATAPGNGTSLSLRVPSRSSPAQP